jgi:GntR family transcriptional regulator / MocR family aminotransferase
MKRASFVDGLLLGLLDLSRRSGEPLTRQLTDRLRSLVVDGRLKPGHRLPSSRALARSLGVSRNTVSQAIEQLAAEGYLNTSQSRRPIVAVGVSVVTARQSDRSAQARAPEIHLSRWAQHLSRARWPHVHEGRPRAFQPGLADEREFPNDVWGRCFRHAVRSVQRRTNRSHNHAGLQEALLKHLADARGIKARPEQVIILPSAQAGTALIARVMIEPGEAAWIESPGYGGAFAAFQAAGARIVGVPLDADGLQLGGRRKAPRIIFVTPSHQYPTGRLMPVGRRMELLRYATDSGTAIIEDDYDGEFHYEGRPVASLAGLDPSARVFYIGTFSKSMVGDIRVGYLVVPEAFLPTFALAQQHLGSLVAITLQAALAEFIATGAYLSHVRRMTRLYRTRRERLVQALAAEVGQRLLVEVPTGGMQLLARCDSSLSDVDLSRRLQQAGVVTRPLSGMLFHKSRERGLFLGFAAWNEREIDAGAQIIGRHLR